MTHQFKKLKELKAKIYKAKKCRDLIIRLLKIKKKRKKSYKYPENKGTTCK